MTRRTAADRLALRAALVGIELAEVLDEAGEAVGPFERVHAEIVLGVLLRLAVRGYPAPPPD